MYKVTKQFKTETAHRLKDHPGLCRNLHGHSYLWEVSIEGNMLQPNGMIMDFSDIKKTCETYIMAYDHATVLEDDRSNKKLYFLLRDEEHQRVMQVPFSPTAENMAMDMKNKLKEHFPNHLVSIKLWETTTSYVEV